MLTNTSIASLAFHILKLKNSSDKLSDLDAVYQRAAAYFYNGLNT